MKYNFTVNLDVYPLFLKDKNKLDVNYMKQLGSTFDEFRIKSDDDKLENRYYEVFLVGLKDGLETILESYLIDCENEWEQ